MIFININLTPNYTGEKPLNETLIRDLTKYHAEVLKIVKDGPKDLNHILKKSRIHKKMIKKAIDELISSGFIIRNEKEDKKEYYYITSNGEEALKNHDSKTVKDKRLVGRHVKIGRN
ncbi:MAG: DUF4364 family protein [Methanobrevibacter sp.]|nr:DUF4364 family protein [Methanobrevibacter sp.]